jgi:hypothetical protein
VLGLLRDHSKSVRVEVRPHLLHDLLEKGTLAKKRAAAGSIVGNRFCPACPAMMLTD